jgi:hypothetical protein
VFGCPQCLLIFASSLKLTHPTFSCIGYEDFPEYITHRRSSLRSANILFSNSPAEFFFDVMRKRLGHFKCVAAFRTGDGLAHGVQVIDRVA